MTSEDATWIPFKGRIEQEDESGIILITTPPEPIVRIRMKKGDYRITRNSLVEVGVGTKAEWMDPPLSCSIKK